MNNKQVYSMVGFDKLISCYFIMSYGVCYFLKRFLLVCLFLFYLPVLETKFQCKRHCGVASVARATKPLLASPDVKHSRLLGFASADNNGSNLAQGLSAPCDLHVHWTMAAPCRIVCVFVDHTMQQQWAK